MGHEGPTAQLPGAVSPAPARAARVAIVVVAVRIALILMFLVLVAESATGARHATLGELAQDLAGGRVTSIQVERADPGDSIQGSFALRWDAGWRDSYTEYEYRGQQGVDEAAPLLERARAAGVPVQVVSLSEFPPPAAVTPEGWVTATFGPWAGMVALLGYAFGLGLLITSPPPWLATKWAWFWVTSAVPLLWLAFLALEPRPLRHSLRLAAARRAPAPVLLGRERRLTGGWAFVIAWAASGVLSATGLALLSTWR